MRNPFPDNVEVDYRHINDKDVVALPRDLHRLYYGHNHRYNLQVIIKQIYKKE